MGFKFVISPEFYRMTLLAFALIFLNEYFVSAQPFTWSFYICCPDPWVLTRTFFFFSVIEFSSTEVINSVIYVLT